MEKILDHEPRPLTLRQLELLIGWHTLDASPMIITISGGSGSGKSTLTDRLQASFPNSVAIHTDDYYIGKTRMQTEMPAGEETNFDHPAAIDIRRIVHDLTKLKNGEKTLGARYNMLISEPATTELMRPAPLIIVEGIIANNDELRRISDLTVVAQSTPEARLKRRIERDATRKGYDAATIREIFERDVEPSYQKYYQAGDQAVDFTIKREEF
jgi:uridine kinase